MKRRLLRTLLAAFALAACASGGPPVTKEDVAEAEVALHGAETAGAEEYAPELLRESRESLEAARRASSRGDEEAVRRYLLEAQDYAAAAEARARAEKLRRDADRLRGEADELEDRTRQIMEEARRPPA